jgi:hypothetical protein
MGEEDPPSGCFCSAVTEGGTTEATAFSRRGPGYADGHPLPASQLARAKSGSFAAALHNVPVHEQKPPPPVIAEIELGLPA